MLQGQPTDNRWELYKARREKRGLGGAGGTAGEEVGFF